MPTPHIGDTQTPLQARDWEVEVFGVKAVLHWGAALVDLRNGHWTHVLGCTWPRQGECAIGPLQLFW